VLVEGRGFELLDATAKTLRAPAEAEERVFAGEIVQLHRDSDDERIAVLRFLEGGRRLQARLHLTPEEYRIACDAHRDGKPVRATGRLERVGHKQWRLLGLRDFGPAEPPLGPLGQRGDRG
jgi:hypothetical protein